MTAPGVTLTFRFETRSLLILVALPSTERVHLRSVLIADLRPLTAEFSLLDSLGEIGYFLSTLGKNHEKR